MEFAAIAVLVATVKKLVDFVRFARAGNLEGILIQVVAWAGGVAVVMLAAHTAWAGTVAFGQFTLAGMNSASQILAGIALGSAASLTHDVVPHPGPTEGGPERVVGAHRRG